MTEFINELSVLIRDNSLIKFCLIFSFLSFWFVSSIQFFSRILFDDDYSFGSLFALMWDLLKKGIAAVLRFFRCFGLLYKLGLAVEGVDFVDCDDYECCSCPFGEKCLDNQSRKEVGSDG